MTYIRQGDLLFVPVDEVPAYIDQKPLKPLGTRILAAGEATGHHHQIAEADVQGVEVYKLGWQGTEPDYLRVTADGGISIVHEEHYTVHIPAGTYKIHRAREFDYAASVSRQVRD